MKDEIGAHLKRVQQENDCRVLYACESGSRAWGFASPDSDYDVRFIYLKPRDWYLRLDEPRDTIEAMLPGDIDLVGWELRKTLRLFQRGNYALYEWIGSPIVYRADTAFHARLTELIPAYFNPKRAMFHYLRIAEKALGDALSEGKMGIKRIFYVLRPLAACEWTFAKRSMPPTAFAEILAGIGLDSAIAESIDALLVRKRDAKEKEPIAIPSALAEWIEGGLALNTTRAEEMEPAPTPGWEPLNAVMRTFCGGARS
jgi:uncharacterized protein